MRSNDPSKEPLFANLLAGFQAQESTLLASISQAESDREQMWTSTLEATLLHRLNAVITAGNALLFKPIVFIVFVVALIVEFSLLIVLAISAFGILIGLNVFSSVIESPLRNMVFARNRERSSLIADDIKKASFELEQLRLQFRRDWQRECDIYVGRPPDWKERRERVLARDSHKCQECGYPWGSVRRKRELHVHHVIHIAEGGNSALSNLITLCHVCHGKIDRNHSGVKQMHPGRTFRR